MSLTQHDLLSITSVVKDIVDEAIEELGQRTAAGFAEVHGKLAEHDQQFVAIRTDLNRIENKLDTTIDRVDDYAVRIRALEPKTA